MFEYPVATPVLAMLYYHPSREASVRHRAGLRIEPPVRLEDYIDTFGNRCARFVAGPGQIRFWDEGLVEDSGKPDRQESGAEQHEIYELPNEALSFLLPSRYCEVDRMLDIAWQEFGDTPPGWARVQAVCDFVHQHLRFDYLEARSTRTAFEAYQERVGVCRDFTHLAIALCRCLNIPARYFTGYLGDIGVPQRPIRWTSALGSMPTSEGNGTRLMPETIRPASAAF